MTVTLTADLRTRAHEALTGCGVAPDRLEEGGPPARTPVTGETLFGVRATDPDDVAKVVTTAQDAFLVWRTTPAPVRGALVKRLSELLVEHRQQLADLVTIEAGKIGSEALGEVQEMVDVCDFAVGLSRQLYGSTMPSERPGHRLMETWHPLGVVGVISRVQLPGGGVVVEHRGRAGLWRRGGVEAVRAHAADRRCVQRAAGPGDRGDRLPAGTAPGAASAAPTSASGWWTPRTSRW